MRKKLRPKIFISYSWDDIDKEILDYIIFLLNQLSDDIYEIIYDKQNHIGDNINDFIDFLKTV
ncbi:MAG TPA: hypothetical protein ENK91_08045, partial [Bacteroidetes bacterium]|nr:hypothetical protein [Bacteroidota bacterium]